MSFSNDQIIAMVAGASFAAGLNVYATVATLGLLSRTGLVALPSSLDTLQSWWIIGTALALFGLEFFADKIPAFDLVWNALHTFIRVPVAALMAYAASSHLSPSMQLMSVVLGSVIAFAAHGSKVALRAAVTPSPEPFSNMALSFSEDVGAVTLTWFAVQHPFIAAGIVAVLLAIIILMLRWIIYAMRSLFRRATARVAA